MPGFLTFVKANPALAPLFLAVGLGVGGGLAFGAHYLANNQDVVITKKSRPQPWNLVSQDRNTKLLSWNRAFWDERKGMADPRSVFTEIEKKPEGERTEREKAVLEKVKKYQAQA